MTQRPAEPPRVELPEHGPTELVEDERGELFERLSGTTATFLLVWLVGVGGLSTLLGAWLYVWIISGERLGAGSLFGGFGLYTALGGAAGPCVLWLAGRAQGHGPQPVLVAADELAERARVTCGVRPDQLHVRAVGAGVLHDARA